MTTSNRSEAFGNLLKGAINGIANYEGKTAPIIEEELGDLIGLSGKTIQRYKSGYLPPFDRDNDAVRVLAEAAVRRGFVGREWLQRFLHAARYPAAEKLLDELTPAHAPRPKPERVYENLPAPTYSHFVMRQQAFAEVVEGIERRSSVVLIASLGGMGKTSLAREIAAYSLQADRRVPHFDAVVWVSDRDRPGTTTFSLVLDTIAQTLDYPGIVQYTHSEKQYEVEQLLRRQRVLLVVDNFETITDCVLLDWLLRLPEPSKAIITTRQYRREFRNSAILVNLHGMTESEMWELVDERLRVLGMEKMVGDTTQLEPLLTATGGNPKAITLTMGLLKYERRPLQQIVDDLYAARGDLFDDLFSRAWALLDEAARRVLMIATFFVDSASSEALSATADVAGFDFDRAMERLTDLSLLDEQRADLVSEPRYTLHPLVRAFAGARLAGQPDVERAARERWVEWYLSLITQTGTCWDEDVRFELLDREKNTCYSAIKWVSCNGADSAYLETVLKSTCYYFGNGYWDKVSGICDLLAKAAQKFNDYSYALYAMSIKASTACDQDDLNEAKRYLADLQELAQFEGISEASLLIYQHSCAEYWFKVGDIERAKEIWEGMRERTKQVQEWICPPYHIALCLYRKGDVDEACSALRSILGDVVQRGDGLNILNVQYTLAEIALDQRDIDSAAKRLNYIEKLKNPHRSRYAEIVYLYFRLHTLRGELPEARASLSEAIDLFERIGMRRELAEARAELARLEAQMAAATE